MQRKWEAMRARC